MHTLFSCLSFPSFEIQFASDKIVTKMQKMKLRANVKPLWWISPESRQTVIGEYFSSPVPMMRLCKRRIQNVILCRVWRHSNAVYVSKWKTQATPIIHFCTELSPSTEITVTMPGVLYKSFTKEKTLSRNIIELGISAMALLVIAYMPNNSRIKIYINEQPLNKPRVSIHQSHPPRIRRINLSNFSLLTFAIIPL